MFDSSFSHRTVQLRCPQSLLDRALSVNPPTRSSAWDAESARETGKDSEPKATAILVDGTPERDRDGRTVVPVLLVAAFRGGPSPNRLALSAESMEVASLLGCCPPDDVVLATW